MSKKDNSGAPEHNAQTFTPATPCNKYNAAMQLAASLANAPIVFLAIPHNDGYLDVVCDGLTPDSVRRSTLVSYILENNQPLLVQNAEADPLLANDELVTGQPGIKSFLCVPILSHAGVAIGCIAIADSKKRKFSKKNTNDLVQLAAMITPTAPQKKQVINEALYRNYFDHTDDVVFIVAPDKKIIAFNSIADKLVSFDHGRQVMAGDMMLDYVPPPFLASFDKHFTETLAGQKIEEDISLFSETNEQWWQIRYSLLSKKHKAAAVVISIRNITATKKTERILEQISSVSKVGGWESDLVNNTYSLNKVTEQLHEVPEGFIFTWENSLAFYKSGASREAFRAALTGALEEGKPFDIEVEFITYRGNEMWVRIKGESDVKNGKVQRIFGTFQDVTEKRNVYEKLLISQQYFKSLFDHNPDAVFALDLNEKFINVNERVARLAETSAEEMIGRSFAPFCPPDDAESVMYYFNEAQKGNAINFDCGFITAKGNRREVNITNMPIIINGVVVAIYGIAKDISDQLSARNMIQKSEANLKTIFENTDIGYILLTNDLKIVSFNKPAQDYTLNKGLPPLQENNTLISHPDGDNRPSLHEIARDVLAGEKIQYERNISPDSSEGDWYNIVFHPVRGEEHKILGIIIEIENITSRKKGELELSRSLDLLNEQNKRLLNFSYITSHNLRSHTSNIKSIVSFIEEAETDEEWTEMMEHLKTVSNSLDETIHNLNDVVSINNSVNLIYRPLFLIEFVSKATDLLKEQIILKHAIIENKLLIDTTVNYNPAFLESIMLNFLSNALKYSSPDRIPVITLSSYMENGQFVLTIADNGIGIDLEKNGDKLFGFYKTFNGNSDARGLGLFICKNQVEYMGGKIEVESEIGKGTTFKIFFK